MAAKFCTTCGKQISDGAKFCPGCGAKMDVSQVPTMPEPQVPTAQVTPSPLPQPQATSGQAKKRNQAKA